MTGQAMHESLQRDLSSSVAADGEGVASNGRRIVRAAMCVAHNVLKLTQGRTPSLAALATG